MKISFLCDSCRSELTVAAHYAGRTILCPRCRQKTLIPSSSAPPSPSAESNDRPRRSGVLEGPNSGSFAKLCADFAPNPFAFSVRLDEFVPANDEDDAAASSSDASVSKTPSVNELIATLLEEENR